MGNSLTLGQCPRTIEADQNTVDMTSYRPDGHRFLRGTTYHGYKNHDARCLRCGLFARFEEGKIVDIW